MKRAQDIKFIINSGDHKGEQYGFTLAEVDGKKAWTSIRLFYPPPSIVKDKIEMAITAREKNVSLSGAVELRLVNKIIEQLNTIFEETTPVTLIGFDKQQYPVLVLSLIHI